MKYWLMKSEPAEFGIDDLAARPRQQEPWDGVRNYQARNMMRDHMSAGDQAFFYHSSCPEPGIVGVMQIIRDGYPDDTAFDPKDKHYDPKSDPENPRWFRVDVELVRPMKRTIGLSELRQHSALAEMPLLRRGNRLSVMPVTAAQWGYILRLE